MKTQGWVVLDADSVKPPPRPLPYSLEDRSVCMQRRL